MSGLLLIRFFKEGKTMKLTDIYSPIKKELIEVEEVLRQSLKDKNYASISSINDYLLDSPGKRLRSALVIL